jgi:hypothetical protein
MDPQVDIYVITHDGGADDYLNLVRSLEATGKFSLISVIFEQPKFEPSAFSWGLAALNTYRRADLFSAILTERTCKIKKSQRRVSQLLAAANQLVKQPSGFAQQMFKEEQLTSKHQQCLVRHSSKMTANWALVLEGDAGIGSDTIAQMEILIGRLQLFAGPAVFLLAEGFSHRELGVQRVPEPHISSIGGFQTSPATSNTACGYLINLSATNLIVEEFTTQVLMPADWLLARLLQKNDVQTFMFDSPPIAHNSIRRGVSSLATTRTRQKKLPI